MSCFFHLFLLNGIYFILYMLHNSVHQAFTLAHLDFPSKLLIFINHAAKNILMAIPLPASPQNYNYFLRGEILIAELKGLYFLRLLNHTL